ncbi:hypothetical protein NQ318_019130 [Aromia moschata]|uniref:Uncharacterized protein n=1 Tax=Aromia moschata TaxID=1265417 RepID=A0AAV8YSR6_9CUCU|nr:hypothetical protein NQ318_019130 [Aromia moschata]
MTVHHDPKFSCFDPAVFFYILLNFEIVPVNESATYEVCKLSNNNCNIAADLATLRRRDLEGRMFKS